MNSVKKILLPAAIIIFFVQAKAQDSLPAFTAYRFTLPGAAVTCSMVPIKEGFFIKNSAGLKNVTAKTPQQKIDIPAFWMGALEVSRDEFDVFYKDVSTSQNSGVDAVTRPSPQYIDFSLGMGKEGGYPVNSLSQYAALMYCRWLYNKTGIFYRLPSEVEWEYASRAGNSTAFYFGNNEKLLDQYAWYKTNSDNKFHKSGLKLPNAWGLYDMLGNVCEWTLDHYEEQTAATATNSAPLLFAPPNLARYPKVLKGGSYADAGSMLKAAVRFKSDPSWNRRDPQIPKSRWWLTEAPWVGFRILRPFTQPSEAQINEFYKQYLGK
jgi:formylglycine-generating enzyme required for sulfatase activity